MNSFENFNLSKQLHYAIDDLGYKAPTPIQEQAFSVILSGKDMVGIAQTGTGKTFAYMLPLLKELKYSRQVNPRILVIVPTRELVIQVVDQINAFAKYSSVRVVGVYGGVNLNTHKREVAEGLDILVATPGRLYDLALSRALQLKSIKKLVIDEVDVMLDLGFRFQLNNIFDLLPERRQNIMFSATITEDIEALINTHFIVPKKISVAVSGTPLKNIEQHSIAVPNFYTKINVVTHLLKDKESFTKVLVFVPNKKQADLVFDKLEVVFPDELVVIHSNKTQNYRIRSIENFNSGSHRILIATDVMARGLDLDAISHVININTPQFPENYMHRIGRTGRAEAKGVSYVFYTEKEQPLKEKLEELMKMSIPEDPIPDGVSIEQQLLPEERTKIRERNNPHKVSEGNEPGPSFHEKKEKNKKVNQGGSYKREIKKKYKKPKTRGDKNYNRRKRK